MNLVRPAATAAIATATATATATAGRAATAGHKAPAATGGGSSRGCSSHQADPGVGAAGLRVSLEAWRAHTASTSALFLHCVLREEQVGRTLTHARTHTNTHIHIHTRARTHAHARMHAHSRTHKGRHWTQTCACVHQEIGPPPVLLAPLLSCLPPLLCCLPPTSCTLRAA